MKLYALNEKESGKHPSCVAIPPPQTEELACPHAMLENKERWLLQYVEIDAWCKTTWKKGGVENE